MLTHHDREILRRVIASRFAASSGELRECLVATTELERSVVAELRERELAALKAAERDSC